MNFPCILLMPALLSVTLASCGELAVSTPKDSIFPAEQTDSLVIEKKDLTIEAYRWADSLTRSMSVEEQLAQTLMPAMFAKSDPYSLSVLTKFATDMKVGGILLLKGEASSAAIIADSLQSIRDGNDGFPGTFVALDAETGLGMRFSDSPTFPWNNSIIPEADQFDFFEYGREVGREARIAGINMVLGPVVDVDRSELRKGDIMQLRSLGSDPERISELSIAYARGLESRGVLSVAKHFPGHGATSTDSHSSLPSVSLSRDEIMETDLKPFRRFIENGLSAILVGHIWIEALDSVKRPASFSPVIINNLLREEMGFEGLVLVDAVSMGAARGYTGADAIAAGADIIVAPADTGKELDSLLEAYESGVLSRERIADTCRRILFYKYLLFVNSDLRREEGMPNEIEERLHKEAPSVIERLKP